MGAEAAAHRAQVSPEVERLRFASFANVVVVGAVERLSLCKFKCSARSAVERLSQSSPYFDPTHTRTGWIGQPPILNRHEVVTIDGDVDTLGQATP